MDDATISIDLALELRLAGGTLTGAVVSAGQGRVPFTGWLGLVGAIDALLGTIDDPLAPAADRATSRSIT